jgi:formylglycine-generating enzyme required for sulfatase activity
MKRLFCFALIATVATQASDLANALVPDRKPPGGNAPAKNFTNSIGMKFVWIPPGSFMIGSPKEEKERFGNETQHKVTLTKGYYMGVHLVTQEQWQAVMGVVSVVRLNP